MSVSRSSPEGPGTLTAGWWKGHGSTPAQELEPQGASASAGTQPVPGVGQNARYEGGSGGRWLGRKEGGS